MKVKTSACLVLLVIASCTTPRALPDDGPRDGDPTSGAAHDPAPGPVSIDPATLTTGQQRAFAAWPFAGVEMRLVAISGPSGHQVAQMEVINHTEADLTVDTDGAGKTIYQWWSQDSLRDEPSPTFISTTSLENTASPANTTLPRQSTSQLSLQIDPTRDAPAGRLSRIAVLARRTDDLENWWSVRSVWFERR